MIPAIEVRGLTHRYGRQTALRDVDLEVPAGSLFALLGPNGAGKTTLMRILTGLIEPTGGSVSVLGKSPAHQTASDRAAIGYVAEGQPLPGWMTVERLQAYLAPLYPRWDHALASELLERFRVPAGRKIRRMSRGERMKVALLAALAPRPRLLVMDEPFTGMDAVVKDELVRGLLELAGSADWSVFICSHDIGELEMLADHVAMLDRGSIVLAEPMEVLQGRFRHVEVMMDGGPFVSPAELPPDWLGVHRSGRRFSFVISDHGGAGSARDLDDHFPGARMEVRPATLREVFVAMAREGLADDTSKEGRA